MVPHLKPERADHRGDLISAKIREDRWLSAVCGRGVFEVVVVRAGLGSSAGAVRGVHEPLSRHASGRVRAMYYAKVDPREIDVVRALTSAGLYMVDAQVTLTRGLQEEPPRVAPAGLTIARARPEHCMRVLAIAASCFDYSRFHLDPGVPLDVANRIKREWMISYFRKERGDQLLVALREGRPVGFVALLVGGTGARRVGRIDLIGVDRGCRRQGIGRALVIAAMAEARTRCHELRVGTQLANLPSIRLYQNLGFAILESRYVMHLHVGMIAERDGWWAPPEGPQQRRPSRSTANTPERR